MNVYVYDMLICTDIIISFGGESKVLKNVAIDTGAAQSIFNSKFVEDIGIVPSISDKVLKTRGVGGEMKFFCRTVDKIEIGNILLDNIEVDFGNIDPHGEISGLLGMDILKRIRAVIDVEIPIINLKQKKSFV
ncbi:retropepsin-like aspartic protease [Herbivorax sp. ANBcel31]|uniref:retropepsin-like aspartic protease n=1 Tax=Herbivorax sp. ANBcel31 TaxID=3069754 RepID=UPI0027B2BDAB|nr:retropepsin-like aspartic protease [Herbivorax sp. ANBcel31]MDQ2086327.1 retropepsin-like aspartic protease [Herbivorax sp. ANBcel31]